MSGCDEELFPLEHQQSFFFTVVALAASAVAVAVIYAHSSIQYINYYRNAFALKVCVFAMLSSSSSLVVVPFNVPENQCKYSNCHATKIQN